MMLNPIGNSQIDFTLEIATIAKMIARIIGVKKAANFQL
jgi:hypothetical protein